jgi:HAE1 family hydrophobic/amphiphilic exporter-1
MKKMPGVVDPDSSLVVGAPELGVRIDRQRAAELGVSVSDIANTLRLGVGGAKVTDYFENGEQYEVHVRSELPYRNDPGVIQLMTVPSLLGGAVPLNQVVSFTDGTGPSQIVRLNRQRQVTVSCNVAPGASAQAILDQMVKTVKGMNLPPEYTHDASGTSREQMKAFGAFLVAFLLSIVFMYLILAAQFESWVHPITILLALPLTVPFALLAILIFGVSLNIFSMLGILVLFGVVKKNGILQVDHTNQLRARGMNRFDAIIQANRDRLRPILMTTVAFVVGMIPLVLSSGTGANSNRNIGWTVIGGQTFSLLLTLLATPVVYSLFDDMAILSGRMRAAIGRTFRR